MLSIIGKYRTLIMLTLFLSGGVILFLWAFLLDKGAFGSFGSFLLVQVAGLLIFGAGYTAISDYFVRRNFEDQVRSAIDYVRLDESIKRTGLVKVMQPFSPQELNTAMQESSSITMLILRSNSFFNETHEQLRQRIQDGKLSLTVILPNPRNYELMALMSAKFADIASPSDLANSILTVVNVWLKERIYDKLSADRRGSLKLLFIDKYPLYSAYLFDQREFWYIPYQYRDNHQPLSTYIYGREFYNAEIYRDFAASQVEAEEKKLKYDFASKLPPPAFPAKQVVGAAHS